MMRLSLVASLLCLALASSPAFAQAYTDPAAAADKDPDFKVQGEYTGELTGTDGQKLVVGVQVLALGGGKFQLVPWEGGLPGTADNLVRKDAVNSALKDDKLVFDGGEHVGTLDGDVIHVTGKHTGDLKKTERKSPTLGKAAPEGAVVLFDGSEKSVENWTGKGAKLSEDGFLQQGITSKQTFADALIHVEFRLPYMPNARGQGRGNSGIYVQGRHEVQMLDSFALTGEHNECGGIYSVKKPDINMCLPPLAWQTYDIEFTAARYDDTGKKTSNARMTVYHNGVKIHENLEVDKATTASPTKEGPEPGPIYLQDHGNPVRYRNIWVLPKSQ